MVTFYQIGITDGYRCVDRNSRQILIDFILRNTKSDDPAYIEYKKL